MKHRVRFEIDFDSVHCMYLLDLLYLYDTIYILYCQYPIGTFLTYIRLEKILSGTKFPARSFHTLVCVKVVLPRGRAKNFQLSFRASASSSAPFGAGGVGVVWNYGICNSCVRDDPREAIKNFRALNRYTFTI
nr:MAG TPA: hypothetical protein [Caudoviricetes sp.]